MIIDMKSTIKYSEHRFVKANYIIYVDGKPLYAGQSRDVYKRIQKHRSMLKNLSQFATGALLDELIWEDSEVVAYIFNQGALLREREELECLIHLECNTLISKP